MVWGIPANSDQLISIGIIMFNFHTPGTNASKYLFCIAMEMCSIQTSCNLTARKVLPVIIVPSKRKTLRKMFPGKVPKLSMIFPWLMVKMIPNTCLKKKKWGFMLKFCIGKRLVCTAWGFDSDSGYLNIFIFWITQCFSCSTAVIKSSARRRDVLGCSVVRYLGSHIEEPWGGTFWFRVGQFNSKLKA